MLWGEESFVTPLPDSKAQTVPLECAPVWWTPHRTEGKCYPNIPRQQTPAEEEIWKQQTVTLLILPKQTHILVAKQLSETLCKGYLPTVDAFHT